MSEQESGMPPEPIPDGAIIDRDKAELMAYTAKPYWEMASLAREKGMGEEEIRAVMGLADKEMGKKEASIDSHLDTLQSALQRVAAELASPTDKQTQLLEYNSGAHDSPLGDEDAYKLAKDRLHQFLGIDDQMWGVSSDNRDARVNILAAVSPLGLEVYDKTMSQDNGMKVRTVSIKSRKPFEGKAIFLTTD